MATNFHKHTRLGGRDYTQGTFFVTPCSRSRTRLFGTITGTGAAARIELSEAGQIVEACWLAIPLHLPHVQLEEMRIMPDHLHAILILKTVQSTQWVDATAHNDATARTDATALDEAAAHAATSDNIGNASTKPRPKGPRPGSLSAIIGAFKSETTKRINANTAQCGGTVWQPGFHDRIIRDRAGEYERIAQYIGEDPINWS